MSMLAAIHDGLIPGYLPMGSEGGVTRLSLRTSALLHQDLGLVEHLSVLENNRRLGGYANAPGMRPHHLEKAPSRGTPVA